MSEELDPREEPSTGTATDQSATEEAPAAAIDKPSLLRRFLLRHLPISFAIGITLLIGLLIAAYFVASSPRFEDFVRHRLQTELASATGARVEIADFHWHLLKLEAEASGVTLHGREEAKEAPYMQIAHLRVGISILDFITPQLIVREIAIEQPRIHLIAYPDGSTNAPTPKHRRRKKDNSLENFFNLRVGKLSVREGDFDYDNRASDFDFESRHLPLDLAAQHLHLELGYQPAAARQPERYHIETTLTDLDLRRGQPQHPAAPPVHGSFHASLDLEHNAILLQGAEITANKHTLRINGRMDDFNHPRWRSHIEGELEMPLIEPLTGYPHAPEGLAQMRIELAGNNAGFRLDGALHASHASYIGTGVVARDLLLDAQLHADTHQLIISPVTVHLHEGGTLSGAVTLNRWLDKPRYTPLKVRPPDYEPSDDYTIPVEGKVSAQFGNVALDTLLTMVSPAPFQRLGFDTLLNGPAEANWNNGDVATLAVNTRFSLAPSSRKIAGESPASGSVDGTYTQRDGAVDLRHLELHTPASSVMARGHLGAYPMLSPSAINIEVHTHDLAEFDPLLRDLGLEHSGRRGTAALPLALHGSADLTHATWNGSLLDPHITGDLHASQVDLELAAFDADPKIAATNHRTLHVDNIDATGSYAAARIGIDHASVTAGQEEIALDGSLTAPPGSPAYAANPTPSFDGRSMLHAHLRSKHLSLATVENLAGEKIPARGTLEAQLQLDGPLKSLTGAGSITLSHGALWDEPVDELRATGSFAGHAFQFSSITASLPAGKIAASGSYDMGSRHFTLEARGSNLEVGRIEAIKKKQWQAAGKLGFNASGSGTLDDPHMELHASITALSLNNESLGNFEMKAQAAGKAVQYEVGTHLTAATLIAHGTTLIDAPHNTHLSVDFSRFNIATLLKLAKIPGLNGESSLAGNITVDGPVDHPEAMHGEARLRELAITLDGVHLKSDGGLHAVLANNRLRLDPLHVTGEQTDLHAEGTLALNGNHQVDFAASGTVNLKVAETIDPDLSASGSSIFQVEAHGPLASPNLTGRVTFQDGTLALGDLPNGLSQLHGVLEFNQNRLEVRSLSAISGGGMLNLSGYLAYQHGIYGDLTAIGKGIRIRYPQGISSLADASMRLQGTPKSMTLTGDVVITRFIVSPDFDFAALAAQTNAVHTVASPDAPSNRVLLNVHVASSPQLNFQNAYAKLSGNVDLRLRGTLASPSLLGRISVTEGSAQIAGTRYDLQRGEISFTNPVRIQPNIDLNATARAGDYDITLGIHGTSDKMSVSYRSDPPLPEADVVALLALGRTGEQRRLYTQQQQQTGYNQATDTLLGGALNATVSSRVQKLFGAGSVKVDPNYVGALGNSTSRIIVEEQLGRTLKLTYATNVNTTSQQLIQAEVAINRHLSLLLARDESGVFSIVIKNTRRYR